jgi:hypothetical protein
MLQMLGFSAEEGEAAPAPAPTRRKSKTKDKDDDSVNMEKGENGVYVVRCDR